MAPGLTFPSSCLQTPRTNWWGRTKIKMSAFSAASFTSGMATWNHKNSFNFSQSCMNQCSFKEWLKWPKNISLIMCTCIWLPYIILGPIHTQTVRHNAVTHAQNILCWYHTWQFPETIWCWYLNYWPEIANICKFGKLRYRSLNKFSKLILKYWYI